MYVHTYIPHRYQPWNINLSASRDDRALLASWFINSTGYIHTKYFVLHTSTYSPDVKIHFARVSRTSSFYICRSSVGPPKMASSRLLGCVLRCTSNLKWCSDQSVTSRFGRMRRLSCNLAPHVYNIPYITYGVTLQFHKARKKLPHREKDLNLRPPAEQSGIFMPKRML